MAKPSFICGLDIGSQKTKILVVNKKPISEEESSLEVFNYQEFPSSGVRRGVIIKPEEFSRILKDNISKIDSQVPVRSVYLNVGGSHLFSLLSRGAVAVSRVDQKISEEDVSRALEAAKTINLPSNKEIFDLIPNEFIIDGERGIKEPLGLKGVRLEVEVLILAGFAPYLKNLTKAVLDSELQILDMFSSAIASARACLTEKEKELGVAILDIGAGSSDLAVFEQGNLIHLAVLPIGSSNITNDIAIGLKTDIEIAEKIKIEFGNCLLKGGQKKEKVKLADDDSLLFSQKQLRNIVKIRVSEIFRETNKELKKISKEKSLPGGIVLTGGGAKLPGIVELAKKEFHLPSKIGKPKGIEGLEDDPSLATVCGLVLLGYDSERDGKQVSFSSGGIISKLKKFFKIFIP